MAILVTTHYLEEAEQCHRLGFMVGGEIVVQGTPHQVKSEQPGQLVEWNCYPLQVASDLLKKELGRLQVSIFGSTLHTILKSPRTQIPQIQAWLQEAGVTIQNYRDIDFSLEDAFISVVAQTQMQDLDVVGE
jgi:ABC-2 type transport system ATP-binding protein